MESAFRPCPDGLILFETMRYAPGVGVALLDFHLARLGAGADRLGFTFDAGRARAMVAATDEPRALRLRLTLDGQGALGLRATPFLPERRRWRAAVAVPTVRSDDPWRGIKSSHRALYDRARAEMPTELDELIFLNETGHVAEGAITNVFVRREGVLLTPPLEDGALPGVLRASLLAAGQAREARLVPEDLRQAFFLGNALRGLIAARLAV